MTASKQPDAASAETEAPARRLPLEGVRVLAQAIVWAGPFATVLLSDLGAEVIEVESIQHLNPTRTNSRHVSPVMLAGTTGTYYLDRDGSEGFWNRQAWYNYGKRGCKSITLDLRRERGRELFYELVKHSDAFIENGAADVVDNLAINWETLSAINPELVMVRFPGFGISGPYAHYKGYGNIMEAVVGHTMLRGYSRRRPLAHARLAARRPERRRDGGVRAAGGAVGAQAHGPGTADRDLAGRGCDAAPQLRLHGLLDERASTRARGQHAPLDRSLRHLRLRALTLARRSRGRRRPLDRDRHALG